MTGILEGSRGQSLTLSSKRIFSLLGTTILCWICAYVYARYLRLEPLPLVRFIVFSCLFATTTISPAKLLRPRVSGSLRLTYSIFAVLAIIFSAGLVLGYHIRIDGIPYAGSATENYITSYRWTDLVAFLCLAASTFALAIAAFSILLNIASKALTVRERMKSESAIFPFGRYLAIFSLLLFVMWIPYLLTYWPAIVLSDTAYSINQAIGNVPLNNHHPFLYTLFIQACLNVGSLSGFGATGGLVIYSLIQMSVLALSFAYALCWIGKRLTVPFAWLVGAGVALGGTPYIATYSIAMWKDPFFSIALMLTTIQLANLVISVKTRTRSDFSASGLGLLLLAACLTRNNGIYICLLIAIGLLILTVVERRSVIARALCLRGLLGCVGALALALVVTGPLLGVLNIGATPKAESYGLFLNQMARVAALDGIMSENDRAYLDSLLPLDQYKDAYHPTKADSVKWHESFNTDALENGFLSHWFSLLAKNPILYFEAWELETFGFWAVNVPEVNSDEVNISAGGAPVNFTDNESFLNVMKNAGIHFDNKLTGHGKSSWFALDEWSIPLGWVWWLLLFFCACFICTYRSKWILPLLPCIGLFLTLFIATPMYYWPRYGAAGHFLIPVFCSLPFMALDSNDDQTQDYHTFPLTLC